MPGAAFRSGDRLSLRTVEPEDYAFVHEHWTAPPIRYATNQYKPRSVAETGEVIEDAGIDTVYFLPCVDDVRVGFIWLFHVDDGAGRAEVGYWIAGEHEGNGYATEALRLAVAYAFDDRRLHKVMARVFEWNDASRRVLEKVGFEHEARLREHYYVDGEYVDADLYGLFEDDDRPSAPRS